MKEISDHKKELAEKTLSDFKLVIGEKKVLPDRVEEGLFDVFKEMPNKLLERFRGLIAGIPE